MIDEITRALNGKSDKVDLKAEKIELGKLQDLQADFDKQVSTFDKINATIRNAASQMAEHTGKFDSISKDAKPFIKQAIDLDAPEVAKRFESLIKEADRMSKLGIQIARAAV